MTESTILQLFNRKWGLLAACFRKSVSYKVMRTVYKSIANAWTNSAFVSAFCRDTDAGDGANKGFIYKLLYLPFAFLSVFAGKVGLRCVRWFRSTLVFRVLYCMVQNLIALETRFLGVLLLSGGGAYMLATRDASQLIPLALVLLGAVLCVFHFSITQAAAHSIINWALKTFLDCSPTFRYFDKQQIHKKSRLVIAAVGGVILGFFAAYISPVVSLGLLGALVLLFKVELAVGIAIFAIPFIPTMAAAGLVILCFVSLLLKKIRQGDTVWRFDLMGMLLLVFMIIVFVCSITSAAILSSLQICLLYFVLMSFYFTIINTVKTKKQLYAMLLGFVISGFFVAAYGIVQYALGLDMDTQAWMDETMFSDIKMRAFSTLENPNVLGEYLLLVIPVSIAFLWTKKGVWPKLTYVAISGVLLLCLVLTMSRGCWVGLLVAAAIFITFVDGRYWILGIVAMFALPSFLPSSIINRFLSIGNLSDTSSSYRLFIWLGTLAMLKDYWMVGIGPGIDSFNVVYPKYAYTGIIAPHSHNVYLQIITEMGIAGLLTFLAICFVFFRRMAQTAKGLGKKSMDRIMVVSISSGIAAFLVQGIFDYVFYNYRVFLMFWMVLALAMCIRYTSSEAKTKEAHDD